MGIMRMGMMVTTREDEGMEMLRIFYGVFLLYFNALNGKNYSRRRESMDVFFCFIFLCYYYYYYRKVLFRKGND